MKLTKRLAKFLATLTVVLMIAPGAAATAFASEPVPYGLMIESTEVTSANASDVFGDGTASFDPATSTLTLNNFAMTDNEYGGPMLGNSVQNLKVVLVGENALENGVSEAGIFSLTNITFTGDGSLAVGGGSVLNGLETWGIYCDGNITFDENFTGTVVATGGVAPQNSAGIACMGNLTIKNGTVIANGGKATTSSGILLADGNASCTIQGGVLIAQGGQATETSYGIAGMDSMDPSAGPTFTGGAAVVRAGLVNGAVGSEGRAAFHNVAPQLNGAKVAAKVGYVDGAFQDTTTDYAGDFSNDTGVAIVEDSFASISSIALNPTSNAYFVRTSGGSPGASENFNRPVMNLDGHTVLYANLFEATEKNAMAGLIFRGTPAAVTGGGNLVCVGYITQHNEGISYGLYTNGPLEVNGAHVTCVGGPVRNASHGFYSDSNSNATVNAGSLVAVGGTSTGTGADSVSNGMYLNTSVIAHGTSSVLGVGGNTGSKSRGIRASSTTTDNAAIMGVGGIALNGTSQGIYGTANAQGGTVLALGGRSSGTSSGVNNNGGAVHKGAKVVALGGVGGTDSYGFVGQEGMATIEGELVAAGRTRAINSHESTYAFQFSEDSKALGYTDYLGSTDPTAIQSGTTMNSLTRYKRIVVNELVKYPLYIAGTQVTEYNAADLSAIPGVSVDNDGFASFDPTTNTLAFKKAIIQNPSEQAEIIDPLVYTGEDELNIDVTGMTTLYGAGGSFAAGEGENVGETFGIKCAAAPLTVTLDNNSNFIFYPGMPAEGRPSIGLFVGGALTVKGDGLFGVATWDCFDESGNQMAFGPTTCMSLGGDLNIMGSANIMCAGTFVGEVSELRRNAIGLTFHGDSSTITLSERGRLIANGFLTCAYVLPDKAEGFNLNVVAEPGWAGAFVLGTKDDDKYQGTYNGRALTPDSEGATITYSTDTCCMFGVNYDNLSAEVDYPNGSYTFSEIPDNELNIMPYRKISKIELSFTPPDDGQHVDASREYQGEYFVYTQNPAPDVSATDASKTSITEVFYAEEDGSYIYEPFDFEAGETYYVSMMLEPGFGVYYADNPQVTMENATLVGEPELIEGADGVSRLNAVFQFTLASVDKYPLYIAGRQVTSANAADLTSIMGVSKWSGGFAAYDPDTNTLSLRNVDIIHPTTGAAILDAVRYRGEEPLTITVEGYLSMNGAAAGDSGAPRETHGLDYGDADLTITLVHSATYDEDSALFVTPGDQSAGAMSSAITGKGTLTVNGDGRLNAIALKPKPLGDADCPTYGLDLYGDLNVSETAQVIGISETDEGGPTNTAGMRLHGTGATITLSDSARLNLGGIDAGIIVGTDGGGDAFNLQLDVLEGWSGNGVFVGFSNDSAEDRALVALDGCNATIVNDRGTCSMLGYADMTGSGISLPNPRYPFTDLATYQVITLSPAQSSLVCLGTTEGGTYSVVYGESHEDGLNGPLNIMVESDGSVSVTATPAQGYNFVGWYEGIIADEGPNIGYVVDHTNNLVSSDATYTFTPQGAVNLQAVFESTVKWTRVAGDNRYQTMAKIAQQGFQEPCSYAVVATGTTFPDALAASSLAGYWDCPVTSASAEPESPHGRQILSANRVSVSGYKIVIRTE